jgi:hypothetical protein
LKRAFERRTRDGKTELVDRYEAKATNHRDAPLFGRAKAKRATPRALFRRLEADDWEAAGEVIARRGEPGVRRAVEALARRVHWPHGAMEYVIAALGGRANRGTLERLLARYVRSKKTFAPDPNWNRQAQIAARIAGDILKLDPESERASALLCAMFDHPVAYNRMWATWQAAPIIADAQHRRVHTLALDRLSTAIRRALDAEEEVFVKAIPALLSLETTYEPTLARLKRLLRDGNAFNRNDAIWNLLQCHAAVAHLGIVLDWLDHEPSLRSRVDIASYLRDILPRSTLLTLCRAGLADESPSLRVDALSLADALTVRERCILLSRAARDEPDAELRTQIRHDLASARRAMKPARSRKL